MQLIHNDDLERNLTVHIRRLRLRAQITQTELRSRNLLTAEAARRAAFGSGMAAIAAIFQALAPGDHILFPDDAYFGAGRLVRELMAPWGLTYSVVNMADVDAVRAAMQPTTRLMWVETPSNPLLKITTLPPLRRSHTQPVRVRSTLAFPTGQQPLALGADLVMHATTKYLGGHSDLLGGAVIARAADAFFERIRLVQTIGGAAPSPFDCWLLMRSIRTLPYRMRAHSEHAQRIAGFWPTTRLSAYIIWVCLATCHAIARQQMQQFGGCFPGGATDAAMRRGACNSSAGDQFSGVESLIEHRAGGGITHDDAGQSSAHLRGAETSDDLMAIWRRRA
jgi:cystathionine gamma-synthase